MIIARTCFQRMRGLIARHPQPLLMIFPWPARWGVWMLGMRFGLTLLWLRKGVPVHMEYRPRPRSWGEMLRVSRPSLNADMVLEIPEFAQHPSSSDCVPRSDVK